MKLPDDMRTRDFLRASDFLPERAEELYPNARRLTLGGLFVSHSGVDSQRIHDEIISPVVFDRLPADGYFMHSRGSGGAREYRELMQAALHWCEKFLVVISEASVTNERVQAEVEWTLERSRPILAVRLDRCGWEDLAQMLELPPNLKPDQFVRSFDFSGDLERGQQQLAATLDELLGKFPRGGLSERL